MALRFLVLLLVAVVALPAVDAVGGQKGKRHAVFETAHLRVYVPVDLAEQLRPTVARAEALFRFMCAQADYEPPRRLVLILADRADLHNGWSSQIPFPAVSVDLVAPPPQSYIFAGPDYLDRTLIHEFAHHISNDRNHGVRRGLEWLFGRVFPSDPLSFLAFYCSTPSHLTMPRFWHEGLAQWAESAYVAPDTVWRGRGSDALTHMVWRLHAAAGRIPPAADWRLSHVAWPYGRQAYLYGIAYMRHLVAAHAADPWELVDAQARQWAYRFTDGARPVLGRDHDSLLREARFALAAEQERQLAILREQPLRTATRRTPRDALLGVPAWADDDSVVFALKPAHGRARLHRLGRDGGLARTSLPGHGRWAVRRAPDGGWLYHELDENLAVTSWYHGPDGRRARLGRHVAQVAAGPAGDGALRLAGIRLLRDGRQQLVSAVWDPAGGAQVAWRALPTVGQPWTPAVAADGRMVWVEVDDTGSRLVFARGEQRRVLWAVGARILHPAWAPGGRHLYVCSDVTGVANAYRLDLEDAVAVPRAVTHTLGGVLACVPAPDGRRLALLDHDADGPYIGFIDVPEPRAQPLPRLELEFPVAHAQAPVATPVPLPDPKPYRGLLALRPRYWTPTTSPVPAGGYGASALISDPLLTHWITLGAGVGPNEGEPVGRVRWSYAGWHPQLSAQVSRSELTYPHQLYRPGGYGRNDYTERVDAAELRVGYGFTGLERDWYAYLSATVLEREPLTTTTTVGPRDPFVGDEQRLGLTVGYDGMTRFADSFAPTDGLALSATYEHSGFGGGFERDQILARARFAVPVWPAAGHQLVVGADVGWSEGDEILQETFIIGGGNRTGYPRGYGSEQDVGPYYFGYGIAYRLPLWRPFAGIGTSPLVNRQVVAELFYEAARLSEDRILGNRGVWYYTRWYRSYGLMINSQWEFDGALLAPGIGVVQQVDGDEEFRIIWELGASF